MSRVSLCILTMLSGIVLQVNAVKVAACGKTHFTQRAQGSYRYINMTATAYKRHLYYNDEFYSDLNISLGWERNFDKRRQSSYFFNAQGYLNVGPNNEGYDVRSSDLGLGADFCGKAWVEPSYKNFLMYINPYFQFNNWIKGLWFEVFIPFVSTAWNARPKTCITKNSEYAVYTVPTDVGIAHAGQIIGVMNTPRQIGTTGVVTPLPIVFDGPTALEDALYGSKGFMGFGDAFPIHQGRLSDIHLGVIGFDGFYLTLGYDFLRKDRGNLGIAIDFAPYVGNLISNKQTDETTFALYYFFPSIGRQYQYKLGGILRGQFDIYNRDEENRFTLFADAQLHNLFSGKVTRNLGLNLNGKECFNNWLLLEKSSVKGNAAVYLGMQQASNLLTSFVKIKNQFEGQLNIMLNYSYKGLNAAIGYNFFGRQAESLSLCEFANNDVYQYAYVIKGEAPVTIGDTITAGGFYSASDSNGSMTGTLVEGSQVNALTVPSTLVNDNKVHIADCRDVNINVAAHPRYISHTLFMALNYHWDYHFDPQVGIAAKVEFGSNNAAMNLWGIFLQGGLVF